MDTPPPRQLFSLLPPDVYLATWAPWAFRAALEEVRRNRPDVLVSTAPYESTHLVALAVARHTRVPWIADFRDGWTFEPHRPGFPLALQRRIDAAMERAVVRCADVVIGATAPIVDDLRSRLGAAAVHVPNAWDPDVAVDIEPAGAPQLDSRKTSLIYTGRLSGGWGRSPSTFLAGLDQALRSDPDLGKRLEVVVAGRLDQEEQRMLAAADMDGVVRHVGTLSRGAALALQRAADALLLITSSNAGEATGKLFEYLGAGRPILALAQDNEAARIVQATRTGRCVAPDDVDGTAAAILDLAAGNASAGFAPRGLEPYIQPGPARLVAEQVERAIARRGRQEAAEAGRLATT